VDAIGAGQITITSGYTLDNGTLNVGNNLFVIQGGGNRLTTINSNVTTNVNAGGALRLQSNSGALTSSGPINLNGGNLILHANNATNAVTLNGNINVAAASTITVSSPLNGPVIHNGMLTGSAPLSITNSAADPARVLQLAGNNSGYSGPITLSGSQSTRLVNASAGSATATWSVNGVHALEIAGVTVDLGALNGNGQVRASTGSAGINVGAGLFTGILSNGAGTLAVTKVGPGTFTFTGSGDYTGGTAVNAGTLITTSNNAGNGNVTVGSGARFGVQSVNTGTFVTPSLTTSAGSTILLDTAGLGNPTTARISATTFTPAATTTLSVTGAALTVGNGIPLIDYTTIGAGGFGALSLRLPPRHNGVLVNNGVDTRVDLNITSVEQIKWTGATNGNWDIDPDGSGGTGTANWITTVTNAPTKYIQGTIGSDVVTFDDTAGGTGTINLTTTLTPAGITVNNTSKNYTFAGAGKLSGAGALNKQGTGTLVLANTVAYDHTGGTVITGGTLQIGDGVTAGAGVPPVGAITNNGTLVLNRPDDFTFTGAITGSGDLVKNFSNTVRLGGGATINGVISGAAGTIESAVSGATTFGGTAPNTFAGVTAVSAGALALNKPQGVTAVAGNLLITGSGTLGLTNGEQIADTATITFTGTSADSVPVQNALETVANVVVNPSVVTGQFIMRSGFTITGTGTVSNGILGVASAHSATVNAINMTSSNATVRIAGSGGASTLNVGPGGITASGGDIQVKFNTNNQDATLNLGGDFTATGDVTFSNAGYTGTNLNVIILAGGGPRTFNIATGTTTTIAPDITGFGLIKTGGGTLSLEALCTASYAGDTVVSAGTLLVKGSIAGSAKVDVSGTGILGGTGTIAPATGGNINLLAGGKLSPGASAGTLTATLSGGGAFDISAGVAASNSQSLLFELGSTASSDKVVLTGGALNIGNGVLGFNDFAFTALPGFGEGAYTLFDGNSAVGGSLDANPTTLSGNIGSFIGTLALGDGGRDIVLTVVPEPASASLLLAGLGFLTGWRPQRRR
jgi:autotransporter-associated beta strand protein